jgi:hypothetical protein
MIVIKHNEAVSIRLPRTITFEEFKASLDKGEKIEASVITLFKCSNADKCEVCDKSSDCEILRAAMRTAQQQEAWAKTVEQAGGYVL